MTVQRRKEDATPRVIMHRVADIRGGVAVAASELGGNYLVEGALLSAPDAKGLCHVVKTAKLAAEVKASETSLKVEKGHNFAVGNYIMAKVGDKAYAVTAVDSTNKAYDVLTIGTALGKISKGAMLFEAKAESTASDSALKYEPKALNGTGKPFAPDSNINTDAWLIAVTKGYELPDAVKAYLPGIINY